MMREKIVIVGAGLTGLTTAYRLQKQGVKTEIFESNAQVGGLAGGFKTADWNWMLEYFYHHIFRGDREIMKLAQEIGQPVFFSKPLTALYYHKQTYGFDTPLNLLKFPPVNCSEKLRIGLTMGFCKIFPFWNILERTTADEFLKKWMGQTAYEITFKPLIEGKFGSWHREVNAAWFWARIKKRTKSLGYFEGGFQHFSNLLQTEIEKLGGKVHLSTPVSQIRSLKNEIEVVAKKQRYSFSKALITTSNSSYLRMVKGFSESYQKQINKLRSLNAITLVFVMKKPLLDKTYWLNISDSSLPFILVCQHTNMISKKHYGGQNIVYLGTYLTPKEELFYLSDKELFSLAYKQMRGINSEFSPEDVLQRFIFKAPEAQPLITCDYRRLMPEMITPIKSIFLANLSMIYPWDRGTNNAVIMGEKAAKLIRIR